MLYEHHLKNWLVDQKIYKKESTYTVYYNIVYNQIVPNIGNKLQKLWHLVSHPYRYPHRGAMRSQMVRYQL